MAAALLLLPIVLGAEQALEKVQRDEVEEDMRELRGEVEQLRGEVRREGREKGEENTQVLLNWLRETVQDLQAEVRSLELAAERREGEMQQVMKQMAELQGEVQTKVHVKKHTKNVTKGKVQEPKHLSKKYLRQWMGETGETQIELSESLTTLEGRLISLEGRNCSCQVRIQNINHIKVLKNYFAEEEAGTSKFYILQAFDSSSKFSFFNCRKTFDPGPLLEAAVCQREKCEVKD